jgi:hypothetical protein
VKSSNRGKPKENNSSDEQESDGGSHKSETTNGAISCQNSVRKEARHTSRQLSHEIQSLTSSETKKGQKEAPAQRKIQCSETSPPSYDLETDVTLTSDEGSDSDIEVHDGFDDSEDNLIYDGGEISDDDGVISVGSEGDSDDDSDDVDVMEMGGSSAPNVRQTKHNDWSSSKEVEKMELTVVALELKLVAMKEEYENKLQGKVTFTSSL